MSPRTKEQFEEIRQNKLEKIESIALGLFAHHGYHATSIALIAEKAGISKGLMYNYYDNKEKLLHTITLKVFNELLNIVSLDDSNEPAEVKLKKIITETLNHLIENKTFWQLYISLVHQAEVQKALEPFFKKLRDDYLEYVVGLFEELGSKNPMMDAFILGTMFDGIGLNYVAIPEGYPIDEIKTYMIEMFTKRK